VVAIVVAVAVVVVVAIVVAVGVGVGVGVGVVVGVVVGVGMSVREHPSDPVIPLHAIERFRERVPGVASWTNAGVEGVLKRLVKSASRWGPSSPHRWHLLIEFNGRQFVLGMVTAKEGEGPRPGHPLVQTVLTLDQAIANQKQAFKR